jgi:diketogulonate reductase-like aldo/keto reductase
MIKHLEGLLAVAENIPAVNQIEYHPQLQQPHLYNYCKEYGIQVEAWSPLMKGQTLDHPSIQRIAKKHQKSPAQILIRWEFQKQVITIPKSGNQEHIIENIDIFDFELDAGDMAEIATMDQNTRVGEDPYHVNF